MDDNSKRDPRIANLDVVKVWNEKAGRYESGHFENISRSGLFVITKQPLPVGSKVRLMFNLVKDEPGDADVRLQPVDVNAEVVRTVNPDEAEPGMTPGMGVKFLEVPEEVRKTIDDIIASGLEPTPTG